LTDTVAVLVQPLEIFVTVTVYVPDELTLGFADVEPPGRMPSPDQRKVVPLVGPADNTTDVVVHVNVPPVVYGTGGELSRLTGAIAVLVHPVAPSVTVTVYVPEALILGLALVPFSTIPGPAQLNEVPVEVEAESTTEVVVQVSVPPVALAPGGDTV
jgi:hypothetical protein